MEFDKATSVVPDKAWGVGGCSGLLAGVKAATFLSRIQAIIMLFHRSLQGNFKNLCNCVTENVNWEVSERMIYTGYLVSCCVDWELDMFGVGEGGK